MAALIEYIVLMGIYEPTEIFSDQLNIVVASSADGSENITLEEGSGNVTIFSNNTTCKNITIRKNSQNIIIEDSKDCLINCQNGQFVSCFNTIINAECKFIQIHNSININVSDIILGMYMQTGFSCSFFAASFGPGYLNSPSASIYTGNTSTFVRELTDNNFTGSSVKIDPFIGVWSFDITRPYIIDNIDFIGLAPFIFYTESTWAFEWNRNDNNIIDIIGTPYTISGANSIVLPTATLTLGDSLGINNTLDIFTFGVYKNGISFYQKDSNTYL